MTALEETLRVSCLRDVAAVAKDWSATHVVSLIDPELADELVPRIERGEHHLLRLRDQENAASTGHFQDTMTAFFDVVLPAIEQQDSRILVHCHAGVSRSTAFAYAIIAHRFGPGREAEAFDALLTIVRKPWPNRRIIEVFDDHWGRQGRMLAPLDAMRAKHPKRIDAWLRYNEKRGLFATYGR